MEKGDVRTSSVRGIPTCLIFLSLGVVSLAFLIATIIIANKFLGGKREDCVVTKVVAKPKCRGISTCYLVTYRPPGEKFKKSHRTTLLRSRSYTGKEECDSQQECSPQKLSCRISTAGSYLHDWKYPEIRKNILIFTTTLLFLLAILTFLTDRDFDSCIIMSPV